MSGAEPTDGLGPWRQYICRACGLVYDEADGDPDSGLAPGTRFADIADDWECPICGVTKTDFEPYVRRDRVAAPSAPAVGKRGTGIVIVGGGTAGWSVAEAIRRLDKDVPLSLVTSCAGDRYNKPELSGALARGSAPQALLRATGADSAARLDVRLIARTDAVGASSTTHRLRTTRGTLAFTHLVLAQGARSALPAHLPPALCWRINDWHAWSGLFAELAGGAKRVTMIGAGMVGCELAEDMARAGHDVTLLARTATPIAGLLPDRAGRRLAAGLAASGVRFRGNTNVRAVAAGPDGVKRVTLDDGTEIEADVVVAATGLATPSRLARSANLAFERGIVVDPATLRTSAPDIFALGDCITIAGEACRFIEPIARQAEAIAHAVLGRDHAGYIHAAPTIRLKIKSTPIVVRGSPGTGEWRVVEDSADRLLMEQWRDGDVAARLAA